MRTGVSIGTKQLLVISCLSSITLIILLTRLVVGAQPLDDAYITYRYARNIAEGVGFVFNAGDRVMGTTTPLYTVILSLLYHLEDNLPRVSLILNAVSDVSVVLLLYAVLRRLYPVESVALGASVLTGLSWFGMRISVGGMEAPLFTLVILATLYLFMSRRYTLSAIGASVATLVRPEGVLLALGMLGLQLLLERRGIWRPALAYAIMLLPWVVFATVYFGSPIPQSVQAKALVYEIPAHQALKSILGYLADITVPFAGGRMNSVLRTVFALSLAGVGVLCFCATVRKWQNALFWLFPVLYLASYWLANPPVWEWYVVPLIPFTSAAFVMGVSSLFRYVAPHRFRALESAVIIFVIIATAISGIPNVSAAHLLGRETAYHDIASSLYPHIGAGQVVAAPEIGTIGYFLPQATILDTQGIISPESVPHQRSQFTSSRVPNGTIPTSLLIGERPDYVITLELFLRYSLIKSDWFNENYRLVDKRDSRVFGSNGVLVYKLVH